MHTSQFLSSRRHSVAIVNACMRRRLAGAAKSTIGTIVAHAINQELSQCAMKANSPRNGALAIAAAIAEVNPPE